jgi:carboxymethylenebutenolidase
MIEEHVDIATADGAMNTFVVHPEERGPHPVVFFYMDAPGKREELHDMARRLASVGYFVVLPNLYYRRVREWYLTERTEEKLAVMFGHMHSLTNGMVVQDTAAMLKYVDQHPNADAAHIGAVGYCMSGPFVMAAAASFPDRIQAIASIHGANLVTDRDDSAHLMAPKIKCESYFACAEIDRWASREIVEQLEAALKAGGTNYRIEWYPKLEHGFVFPQRACYDKPGSERHWERLFDLFGRNVRGEAR